MPQATHESFSYPLSLMNHSAAGTISRKARILPWPALLLLGMWAWAIWSCAEHWQGNPNYSYGWAVPPLALGFGLRRYWKLNQARLPWSYLAGQMPASAQILAALSFGGLVFLLEYFDGMQAASYMLEGHVKAWSFAAKLKGSAEPVSTFLTRAISNALPAVTRNGTTKRRLGSLKTQPAIPTRRMTERACISSPIALRESVSRRSF